MNIIINREGFQFLGFIKVDEAKIHHYNPLAGSFAIIQCHGKYLICFNKWRMQWELPAGRREDGETPIECAQRELYEETGQKVTDLTFKGLLKVSNSKNGEIKYNPVYFSSVKQLQPFRKNDEITEIKLWDPSEDIGYIDEVDIQILNYI